MRIARTVLLLAAGCAWFAPAAGAQTPQTPPDKGFTLHEQRAVDRFVVQRWVSEASPDVSPAGFCECITLVYEGNRQVLNLGLDVGLTSVTSVGDVTGDRLAELVISGNSGGAHCCQSTSIYSVEGAMLQPLLSLNTDDCSGELIDLDKNGTIEFSTCDASFKYAFCSFAFTPFPPVVFAYDRRKGEFALATPRYARHLQLQSAREARKAMAEYPDEPEILRCSALGPALGLIYTGRVAQG
ncbi:MAG: hypothetical protein ABL993_15190, partial [Vicinamibacterales bacterium]